MKLAPIKNIPPETEFLTGLLGIAASNSFAANNSPARQQMYTNSHIAQKLVTFGMGENFISNFMDFDLGKSTFNISMPVTAKILKVIHRYPANNVLGAAVKKSEDNPEALVLYEDIRTKEVGVLTIPKYLSYHPYFGYELVPTKDAKRLFPGEIIEKDTILYDTPGKSATGQYVYTTMLNTCFISNRATAEDGIVICRDVLPTGMHKRYEVRVVEFGREFYPLNVYGDKDNYKIMPDIGEYVRGDGLLMATRRYDPKLAVCDMSSNGSRRVDMYDRSVYAKGKGGKVVDIRITTNYNYEQKGIANVCTQLEKYIKATYRFNADLVKWYKDHRWEGFAVDEKLHVMLVKAMIEVKNNSGDNKGDKTRFNKTFKKINVDDFRIEFVVEYDVLPHIGSKMSDKSGGKGVLCYIAERWEMPVDQYGRSADVMMAPEGRNNRMNSGGNHELFINDGSWHVRRRVMEMLGVPFFESPSLSMRTTSYKDKEKMIINKVAARKEWLKEILATNSELFWSVWDFVINYYRIVAPLQAYIYDRDDSFVVEGVISNLATIIEDMTYLTLPPDHAVNYLEATPLIKEHVGFSRSNVTYTGLNGEKVISDGKVRIAPMAFMFSDKTADSFSAVSFGKYQMHGFLAPLGKSDKYSDPGRAQAINGMGETEGRIIASTCGPRAVAELADRNNNPKARKAVHRSIITADNPGRIKVAVDRNVVKFDGHRGIEIFHHFLVSAAGIELKYSREENT